MYRRRAEDKSFPKRSVFKEAFQNILAMFWRIKEPYSGTCEHRSQLRLFTSQLIQRHINGVALDIKNKDIEVDPEYLKEVAILKELTWTYVVEAPSLALLRQGQREVIPRLFEVYSEAPESTAEWSIFPTYYRDELEMANTRVEAEKTCCRSHSRYDRAASHRGIQTNPWRMPPLQLQEIVR